MVAKKVGLDVYSRGKTAREVVLDSRQTHPLQNPDLTVFGVWALLGRFWAITLRFLITGCTTFLER